MVLPMKVHEVAGVLPPRSLAMVQPARAEYPEQRVAKRRKVNAVTTTGLFSLGSV